jgi:hypothetical protein
LCGFVACGSPLGDDQDNLVNHSGLNTESFPTIEPMPHVLPDLCNNDMPLSLSCFVTGDVEYTLPPVQLSHFHTDLKRSHFYSDTPVPLPHITQESFLAIAGPTSYILPTLCDTMSISCFVTGAVENTLPPIRPAHLLGQEQLPSLPTVLQMVHDDVPINSETIKKTSGISIANRACIPDDFLQVARNEVNPSQYLLAIVEIHNLTESFLTPFNCFIDKMFFLVYPKLSDIE